MRTVLMVLFDQVQSLDVTGPLEVFTGANTWRAGHGDAPAYDIRAASLGGRPVRTSSGLRVTPDEDWPTGRRCATCSGGSPTTRPRTCR
jgi:transcriptional regulator GlxA family with amidase domain